MEYHYIEGNKLTFDFLTVKNNIWEFEGRYKTVEENPFLCLKMDETTEMIPMKYLSEFKSRYEYKAKITYSFTFQVDISKIEKQNISFSVFKNDQEYSINEYIFGDYFPVSDYYKNQYFFEDGMVLKFQNGCLEFIKAENRKEFERKFFFELLFFHRGGKMKKKRSHKAAIVRLLTLRYKSQLTKPLWLVRDRVNRADDNGYAFYRYMVNNHPEIDARFCINENTKEFTEISKIGPVEALSSKFFKIKYLAADYNISSMLNHDVINPFLGFNDPYRDLLHNVKFVYIHHGIINTDMSKEHNRYARNIYIDTCTVQREYDAYFKYQYFYRPEDIALTGLARYDYLENKETEKRIVIMPTWRSFLAGRRNAKTGQYTYNRHQIKNSYFFQFYNSLINDQKLIDAAKKYGYEIWFLPHPNFQKNRDLFETNEDVKILDIDVSYNYLFTTSKLVVTDYTSAVFDFAYLRKPVLYTHFDEDMYYGEQYDKGYFDYEEDGFGEVAYDYDTTVDNMIEYMKNDCVMKKEYKERADRFFTFNDHNNCQRIYEAIIEKGNLYNK